MELSYSWVKQALQGAGLVERGRRPLPGMLLHIDGSRHQWFQDERWYDLIVILDDATSEIYYAQLVEEESTVTVMTGLKEVVERKGVFCGLYSDIQRNSVPLMGVSGICVASHLLIAGTGHATGLQMARR
jgi:hypothetical protein